MAIFKCKMCGGNLNIVEGVSVVECEYCGTQQTVPNADDEKKLAQFSRANKLRFACEFDKAAGIYESIVADFPEEAEAYWGLVLCKYGIEYVDDPATGKKIPTCHRSSFDSVMEDSNFEQALENADVIARRIYREEAKQIEELRKGIIEVSSKEEPYDIFICYKETDGFGDRTVDSVIAQDVYDALVDKGYRVFFSRITLEDKLGVEYEPYIFAALNSAKVMLAVGTDYEYYNAVWVKNEWSRFLQLMTKDKTKHLIPCYKNIDAYDMPKEFARLQAQDMGKVGAMQDLLRGIQKILPREEKKETVKETLVVQQNNGPDVSSLLKRAFMFLEDGDWTRADDFCEQVLNIDPENAEAYLCKLLAEKNISNKESLACATPFSDSKNYQKILRFGDEILSLELKSYLNESTKMYSERLDKIKKNVNKAKKLITTNNNLTIGLKSDGKLISVGSDFLRGCNVSSWHEIVAVASSAEHIVGLKLDGTVIAVGDNSYGKCNVCGWKDIVAIACSDVHTIGLKSDGTVLSVGNNDFGQRKVSTWQSIVAISCSGSHTVGLKADGTVEAVGLNNDGQCNVRNWKDIVAVDCGRYHTIGLKSDGTVVTVGNTVHGKCDVSDWSNIIAISCSDVHTIGLKADGTVVAVGKNETKQCDLKDWQDIVAIACGNEHTIGLKNDGTVLSKGRGSYGRCNVSNIKLFNDINTFDEEYSDVVYNLAVEATYIDTIVEIRYAARLFESIRGWRDSDSRLSSCHKRLEELEAKVEADRKEAESKTQIKRLETLKELYFIALESMNKAKTSKSLSDLSFVAESFDHLGDYSDAKEKAAECRVEANKIRNELLAKKSALEAELGNLKGLFTGKRRKELETQLAEIDKQMG